MQSTWPEAWLAEHRPNVSKLGGKLQLARTLPATASRSLQEPGASPSEPHYLHVLPVYKRCTALHCTARQSSSSRPPSKLVHCVVSPYKSPCTVHYNTTPHSELLWNLGHRNVLVKLRRKLRSSSEFVSYLTASVKVGRFAAGSPLPAARGRSYWCTVVAEHCCITPNISLHSPNRAHL